MCSESHFTLWEVLHFSGQEVQSGNPPQNLPYAGLKSFEKCKRQYAAANFPPHGAVKAKILGPTPKQQKKKTPANDEALGNRTQGRKGGSWISFHCKLRKSVEILVFIKLTTGFIKNLCSLFRFFFYSMIVNLKL